MRFTFHIIFICLLLAEMAFSQSYTAGAFSRNSFLSHEILDPVEDYFIKRPDYSFHSSIKPYNYTTLRKLNDFEIPYRHMKVHNYFLSKAVCDTPSYKNILRLQILPQINMEQGYDLLREKASSEISGGLYMRADINNRFSVAANYTAGYIMQPNFIDTITRDYGIIPGMGVAYKTAGFDSANAAMQRYSFNNFSGYISWAPRNFVNLQIGKDKFFIGDGYRSLLLSDVATNYPYFKTTFNLWHFQYSAWGSWMYDVSNAGGIKSDFKNKFGTFHYLSWNVSKQFNLSFFENIIWQGSDTNRHRGFDANYLNPFIFFRPVEYSLGSSDNAMMGLNSSWVIAKRIKLYGQLVLDEFYLKEILNRRGWWANKQGVQFGARYTDAFGIKKLSLQAEYNLVRPYTYSHGSPQQSYTHFNQPLAHPFGANFKEVVGLASYKHFRYRLDAKFIYAEIGKDTSGSTVNMGQNIFLSYTTRPYDYLHKTGQGVKTTFVQADLRYTFYLIADLNLRLEAGIIQRMYKNAKGFDRQTPFIYAGIKTNLYNAYRDY